MKKITAILLLVILMTAACREDEKMFGSLKVVIKVTTVDGQVIQDPQVGLFDINSATDLGDALYVAPVLGGAADFPELNPGNYRVVFLGTPYSHGVQVKVGETATVTFQ